MTNWKRKLNNKPAISAFGLIAATAVVEKYQRCEDVIEYKKADLAKS
jgi:hypothetical protein